MSELIDRESTVKQIVKMGEMLGGHDRDVTIAIALFVQDDKSAFPGVFSCNACKNMGNERECVDCHDYSNYVHYKQRPHGEWKYEPKLRLVDETDDGAIYETAMKCFCSACGADFGFQKVDDAFCKYCGSDNRKREGEEE